MQDKPSKTPLEDLKRGALQHYEELATKCHHFNTAVPHAIEHYYDHLIAEENKPKSITLNPIMKLKIVKSQITFSEALQALKEKKMVKVPEWEGYWFLKGGEIHVKTWDNRELNTPWYHNNVLREDWQIVEQDIDSLLEEIRNQPLQFFKAGVDQHDNPNKPSK